MSLEKINNVWYWGTYVNDVFVPRFVAKMQVIPMSKVTQKDRVLQYIKENGSITRLGAAEFLGCFELSSRIGELEAQGYKFNRETVRSVNRYGAKVRFTKYTLAQQTGQGGVPFRSSLPKRKEAIMPRKDEPFCFAAFSPEGACLECPFKIECEAETLARDAYWDSIAEVQDTYKFIEEEYYDRHI